jgi:hypothetical protein
MPKSKRRSMDDIFNFWDGLSGDDARIHPADRKVLTRVKHSFELGCFAEPFRGPLKTAPVVLLFLAPGLHERDLPHSPEAPAFYDRQRAGRCDLPNEEEHKTARDWAIQVIKQFGVDYESARSKFAFLNIAPYRSKYFHDWNMLAALPSARVALEWAQIVLFQEAEAGTRTVVCLRSRRYWGLTKETRFGTLFAPDSNRGGLMRGGSREEVVFAVRQAISLPNSI